MNSEDFDDLDELIRESPVGENYGRMATITGLDGEDEEHMVLRPLSSSYAGAAAERDTMHMVQYPITNVEGLSSGLVAHRGVLSPAEAEFIDWDLVVQMAMDKLGTSIDEINRVWRAGTPSAEDRLAKSLIEDRLLELQESGGNMTVLAAVLGWNIQADGKCRTMQKSLRRARLRRSNG